MFNEKVSSKLEIIYTFRIYFLLLTNLLLFIGTNIGEEVLTVSAVDPDENAKLRYSIVEPIVARDKTGSVVTTTTYNYKVN